MLTEDLSSQFRREKEVDFSFSWHGQTRFRANVYYQQGTMAMALRAIPYRIPTMEELGLPPIMEHFAHLPQGLILVTGPTGSGKSTTQASVIDFINQNRECHILTIEDPIEYVHVHKRSAVNQREVGYDTDSFSRALRSALREDPDVILVGEMRDPETIQFALTIAETGHLVFATLHTNDAVDRTRTASSTSSRPSASSRSACSSRRRSRGSSRSGSCRGSAAGSWPRSRSSSPTTRSAT